MTPRQELIVFRGLRIIVKLLTIILYNQLYGEPAATTKEKQLERLRTAENYSEEI